MNNIKIKDNNYCAICGADFKPSGITTGYGIDSKTGYRVCFNCCGDRDKKELSDLKFGDKMYLYLSGEYITNWPGTLKIKCYVKKGSHNIAGIQRIAYFQFHNKWYIGRQYGYYSEICTIKRIKG